MLWQALRRNPSKIVYARKRVKLRNTYIMVSASKKYLRSDLMLISSMPYKN